MRAMRVERANPALLVAEDDDFLAEQLLLPRQVLQLVGEAHRLPIAPQQLAHRAARLDAGQLVIRWRNLPSISRFHRSPPCLPPGQNPESEMQTPDRFRCQRLT